MTTAHTNIRVEPRRADGKLFGFDVVASRGEDSVILANCHWHSDSPAHVKTETEARRWAQLFAGSLELLRVCQEYVRRCEADEIRGNGMYAAMLTAIMQATKPE
jgi:hypothetical protein